MPNSNFTFFAANNAAFSKLPAATLQKLSSTSDTAYTTHVLGFHATYWPLKYEGQAGLALNGLQIIVDKKQDCPPRLPCKDVISVSSVDDASISATVRAEPIYTTNGIIYPIDEVLLPPKTEPDHAVYLQLVHVVPGANIVVVRIEGGVARSSWSKLANIEFGDTTGYLRFAPHNDK